MSTLLLDDEGQVGQLMVLGVRVAVLKSDIGAAD